MSEFDINEDASTELLKQLQNLDVRVESNLQRRRNARKRSCWKSLKWKAALNHIGLLVSLSVYCGVGGWVRVSINQLEFLPNNHKIFGKTTFIAMQCNLKEEL